MRWILSVLIILAATVARSESWRVQVPQTPYDYSGPYRVSDYQALETAQENWRICAIYPHLKDAYWLSVNYGMVQEAARLGVSFNLHEAGGYPNVERQRQQLQECARSAPDAIILGTVSFEGLSPDIVRISRNIPVIAAVNDIADDGITAKVGVSWTEMGAQAGREIAKRHPAGSPPVNVAWFPGPERAGWVKFVSEGFEREIARSSARIAAVKYGDTGREIQVKLVEEALDEVPDLDYIIGSAPAAEAAVSVLRAMGLQDEVSIIADYMTHAVYRGILRNRIISAPTDFPVLQGKMAIEFAVRAIEGNLAEIHAGPQIRVMYADTANEAALEETLAPAAFVPVFEFIAP